MTDAPAVPPPAGPSAGYGFGGAPVVALEALAGASRQGDVVFFGVDAELGRRFGRSNAGAASFVRDHTAGMMPWTLACAGGCHDIGVVTAPRPDVATREVTAIASHLVRQGLRPALIGCDHTASLAAVLGAAAGGAAAGGAAAGAGPIPTYLYLDAHLDLGSHDPSPALHNGNFVDLLRQSGQVGRVINVGARSWSRFAPAYRQVPGFTCLPGGVPPVTVEALIGQLSGLVAGTSLWVSLDADVLDPSCAPNVCCPEPFGLSTTELFTLCAWLGRSCRVIGADLCEVLPQTPSLGSEQALMRCLHALFGENDSPG